MTSPFGPIECHHLVSFYRKNGEFSPIATRLKKSNIEKVQIPLDVVGCFMHMLSFGFAQSAHAAGNNLSSRKPLFTIRPQLTRVCNLEVLLRRGLGYRIIFNMGGKVYNPEDPSTLPDVTFVVTDLAGHTAQGKIAIPAPVLQTASKNTGLSFAELWYCETLEASFTFDRVVITRDGKVELEFFHFDKLLSPEQLKIYNKYASLLGEYIDVNVLASGHQMLTQGFYRIIDHAVGLVSGISRSVSIIPLMPSSESLISKIAEAMQVLDFAILMPFRNWAQDQTGNTKPLFEQIDIIRNSIESILTLLRPAQNFVQEDSRGLQSFVEIFAKKFEQLANDYAFQISANISLFLSELPVEYQQRAHGLLNFTGKTILTNVLAEYFRRSEMVTAVNRLCMTTSSLPCKVGKNTVEVHEHTLKLHEWSPGHTSSEILLPLPMTKVQANSSGTMNFGNLLPGFAVGEYRDHFTYSIRPVGQQRVLVTGLLQFQRYRLLVDLDRLRILHKQTETKSLEQLCDECTYKIEEPPIALPYRSTGYIASHVSKHGLFLMRAEQMLRGANTQVRLYQLDLHVEQSKPEWRSIPIPELEGPPTPANALLPVSVYHSDSSRLLFYASKNLSVEPPYYSFGCCRPDADPQRLVAAVYSFGSRKNTRCSSTACRGSTCCKTCLCTPSR